MYDSHTEKIDIQNLVFISKPTIVCSQRTGVQHCQRTAVRDDLQHHDRAGVHHRTGAEVRDRVHDQGEPENYWIG